MTYTDKYIDITNLIDVENRESDLNMTFYRFPTEVFPKHHKLRFITLDNNLWIASNYGLVNHDLATDKWKLIDSTRGLPNDGVSQLYTYTDKLAVFVAKRNDFKNTLSHRTRTAYLFNRNTYKFKSTNKELYNFHKSIKGTRLYTSNSDIVNRTVNDVMYFKKRYWVTSNTFTARTSNATKGGVAKLKGFSRRGEKFYENDGLASSSCFNLANTDDRYVWVTHSDKKLGLSRYDTLTEIWSVYKESKNGVLLGGSDIIGHDQFLVIGQNNLIVIYNTETEEAVELKQELGFPGRDFGELGKDDKFIWISNHTWYGFKKYTKERKEKYKGQSGLTRIRINSLSAFFE